LDSCDKPGADLDIIRLRPSYARQQADGQKSNSGA
jgi:hypothetical protein